MAETRYSLTTPAGFLVPAPTDTNYHGGSMPYGNIAICEEPRLIPTELTESHAEDTWPRARVQENTFDKIMNNITYSKFPSTPNRPTRPASTNAPNREVQKTHIINTSIVKELTF
tara:strand:+ start:891 stop:1235 length:345 start_codon:yes stop_codon:yes gene_type:complete